MLPVLKEASSRPLTTVAQNVLYCREKPADHDKVAQKDASLKEGLKVVTDFSIGLNLPIGHRQPALAVTFLTRRFRASQTTDSAEPIKKATAELKDISHVVGRHGRQLLAHWYLPATGNTPPWDIAHLQPAGPGVPRPASRSARNAHPPTNTGTQILHRCSG